jgi:hypothetical protein
MIGGYAVVYHGYPRATGDIDVWFAVNPQNASRLFEALTEFGFATAPLSRDLFLQEKQIIRMGIPPFRIELVTSISGVNFEQCYARRVTQLIDGVEVDIIALEDLKANKKASGRLKDLNDLEHLP